MVAITGQVPSALIGTDAFQEADITGDHAADHQAQRAGDRRRPDPGRDRRGVPHRHHRPPRPGARRHPQGLLQAQPPRGPGRRRWTCPATGCPARPGPGAGSRAAARMLHEARRPVLYVGGGVIKSGAHEELRRLAELAQAPVTTTLMARGAFPDTHPLALGMPGMHGCYAAVAALQEADLLVALGGAVRRPGHRQAGRRSRRAPRWCTRHRPGRDRQEPGARRGRSSATSAVTLAALADAARRTDRRARRAGHRGLDGPPPTTGSSSSRCATPRTPMARSSRSTWSSGCPR